MKKRIFVLDDEEIWRDFATDALRGIRNAEIEQFRDCASLHTRMRIDEPDIFVLDWNLPDGTGLSMIRVLREQFDSTIPIIVLTARESETDIVAALQMGADDFVSKPVPGPILAARVEALLRRSAASWNSVQQVEAIAGMRFDTQRRIISRAQNDEAQAETPSESVTAKEFELALLLFRALGTPVSRDAIYAKIWHAKSSVQSRTLDAHITQIRRKLNLRPEGGFQLSTVYGYGYRLEKLEVGQ